MVGFKETDEKRIYDHILKALNLYHEAGHQIEIRRLVGVKMQPSHFKSVEDAAEYAARMSGNSDTKAVYFIPNRFAKDFKPASSTKGVKAENILRRRWLLIDCDPIRPSKNCNASDAETEAARSVFNAVEKDLEAIGFVKPIRACSGNGWHLSYPIDLPNDKQVNGKIKSVLEKLGDRHNTDQCEIDKSVHDAPRIWKIPGTITRKGPDLEDRPHRYAYLLDESPAVATEDERSGNNLAIDRFLRGCDNITPSPAKLDILSPKESSKENGAPALSRIQILEDNGRNNSLFYLARHLRDGDCDESVILASIKAQNEKFSVPLELDEVNDIARKIMSRPPKSHTKAVLEGRKNKCDLMWKMEVESFDQIEAKVQYFLWQDRLPLGVLTVIEGPPKQGKSTLMFDVMARLTTGRPMPFCDAPIIDPAPCLLIALEDPAEQEVKPRLMANGADLKLVRHLKCFTAQSEEKVKTRRFILTDDDLSELERVIVADGIKLVFIDAVMGLVPTKIDSNSDQQIRAQVLDPLADLARTTGTSLVLGRHWAKGATGRHSFERGLGSIAFTGAARRIMQVAWDQDDKNLKLLANIGNGKPVPVLSYRFESTTVQSSTGIELPTFRIGWEGIVDMDPEELGRIKQCSGREDCGEWLLARVSELGGDAPSEQLEREAQARGFSLDIYKRAKLGLKEKIVSRKVGNMWRVRLKDIDCAITANEIFQ